MDPKPMDLIPLVPSHLVVDSPPRTPHCCPANRHAWAPWHAGPNGMPLTCVVFRLVGVPWCHTTLWSICMPGSHADVWFMGMSGSHAVFWTMGTSLPHTAFWLMLLPSLDTIFAPMGIPRQPVTVYLRSRPGPHAIVVPTFLGIQERFIVCRNVNSNLIDLLQFL